VTGSQHDDRPGLRVGSLSSLPASCARISALRGRLRLVSAAAFGGSLMAKDSPEVKGKGKDAGASCPPVVAQARPRAFAYGEQGRLRQGADVAICGNRDRCVVSGTVSRAPGPVVRGLIGGRRSPRSPAWPDRARWRRTASSSLSGGVDLRGLGRWPVRSPAA
jgi:hypothetical protein